MQIFLNLKNRNAILFAIVSTIVIPSVVSLAVYHGRGDVLSTDNNAVSLTTFHKLKSQAKGSVIASPFSVRAMMAMLLAGARGQTRNQIVTAMQFPQNEDELFETYRGYIQQLNMPALVKTEISNRIFMKDGFLVQENFQNILKHYFQSPLQQLSFDKPTKAAEDINDYVSRKTNRRIQKVVESSDFTNQTRMVLVNTLYFKGAWENPFPTASTRKMPFHLDENRSTTVDMMRVETYFRAQNIPKLDSKAIVIPYQKGTNGEPGYEMVLLIPNKKAGLANLERSFDDFGILDSLYKVKGRNIELRLPRFSMDSSFELISPMKNLGVHDVFDENKSDLSGIPMTLGRSKSNQDTKLFVSKMIQKAFLNVDEAGSEAGAAIVAVVFVPLSIGPPVEEVITVDRSFMGFIRDARTNTILFTFRKSD